MGNAPTRSIAFLRAINVGGHTVKMERLRTLFEELGFANVATFIASGNVIFEASESNIQTLEKQIEDHLKQSLGYEVATFIRSTTELADVARYRPFPEAELTADGNALYIAFLKTQPDSAPQQKLLTFRNDVDDFHIYNREVYWLCRRKISESTFSGALLEKTLCMSATMRNVTTVKKLAAKYPGQ